MNSESIQFMFPLLIKVTFPQKPVPKPIIRLCSKENPINTLEIAKNTNDAAFFTKEPLDELKLFGVCKKVERDPTATTKRQYHAADSKPK